MSILFIIIGLLSMVAMFVYGVRAVVALVKADKPHGKKMLKSLAVASGVMIVAFIIAASTTTTSTDVASEKEVVKEEEKVEVAKIEEPEVKEEEKVEVKAKEDSIPREYKSALRKAETYAEAMHMSKAGIYDQLISEYGENFPKEAAQYAIDNIVHDWNDNALKKAQTYAETMNMSDSAVYDQLISEYGEKFTPEEARYAIDNLE